MRMTPLDPGHTPVPATVRALFAPDIAVALCDPRQPLGGLLGLESKGLGRMVDTRQREFTAGRFAARRAMAELGVPPQPVLPGQDRAPVWPEGLVGSLSHCHRLCICALGRSPDVRALGVDVEPNTILEAELLETVCTRSECDWLYRQRDETRGFLAKLLFSAKETAYKAQYPLTGAILDYHDIAVLPDLPRGRFWAAFTREVAMFEKGAELEGRFVIEDGLILTAMTLRHGVSP
ncbi:4'-phosphopantetheinyl transferase family protein [Oceaniglobus roseus]|uniref:4'-phosphopantetheinyl transferase family protein n=1 Tax=Oceaniglobus roseus TaxID=1737570 RepID=UPI000C7EC252|nr:4'-phosphopantetheinyl transferase superfamily protein [Kandeliimicrobium roseum]